MNQWIPEPLKRSVSRLRDEVHVALDRWLHRNGHRAQTDYKVPERSRLTLNQLRTKVHDVVSRWLPKSRGAVGESEAQGWPAVLEGVGPPIDFEETDQELVVVAEMPGFDKRDLSVEVLGDRLILRGNKKLEREERGGNYYYAERSFGGFTRVIPLPCEVNMTGAGARYQDGLLRVVLPKANQSKAKRIEVRSA
jgi:HSP20 family protein